MLKNIYKAQTQKSMIFTQNMLMDSCRAFCVVLCAERNGRTRIYRNLDSLSGTKYLKARLLLAWLLR